LSLPDVELILANAGFAVTGRDAEGNENGTPELLIGGVKLFIQGRFQEAAAGRAERDGAAPRQLRSLHVAQKRLISSNAVVSWDRRSTVVKARIVPVNVVVLALAVGACRLAETFAVERPASTWRRSVPVTPADPTSPVVIVLSIVILAVALGLLVMLLEDESAS
jgi:hypothetical protein